jgi:hypothetical protein
MQMPSRNLVVNKKQTLFMGKTFYSFTDCASINWLMNYKGHNHAVIRLQLEILSYWFTIAVRSGYMMEDTNFFSCLGEDLHIDPLLKDYCYMWTTQLIKVKLHQRNFRGDARAKNQSLRNHLQPPSTLPMLSLTPLPTAWSSNIIYQRNLTQK